MSANNLRKPIGYVPVDVRAVQLPFQTVGGSADNVSIAMRFPSDIDLVQYVIFASNGSAGGAQAGNIYIAEQADLANQPASILGFHGFALANYTAVSTSEIGPLPLRDRLGSLFFTRINYSGGGAPLPLDNVWTRVTLYRYVYPEDTEVRELERARMQMVAVNASAPPGAFKAF